MAETKTIEQMQAELAAANKLAADKEAALVLANKTIQEREADLEEAGKQVADLSKAVEAAEAQTASKDNVVITYNKKKYAVIYPKFEFEGVKYKSEELVNSPEVVDLLFKEGFGGFKLLN